MEKVLLVKEWLMRKNHICRANKELKMHGTIGLPEQSSNYGSSYDVIVRV